MCSRSRVKIHVWFFILASPLESVSLFLFVSVSFSSLYLSLSNTHTHTHTHKQTNIFSITIIPKTDLK